MRFSKQPLVARTDGLNNFWDIDFKRFILQLFHIQPFYKRLSVFSTRVFLCFFRRRFDSAWERARSWSAKKKKKSKEIYFLFFPPLRIGFVSGRTPDSTTGCLTCDVRQLPHEIIFLTVTLFLFFFFFFICYSKRDLTLILRINHFRSSERRKLFLESSISKTSWGRACLQIPLKDRVSGPQSLRYERYKPLNPKLPNATEKPARPLDFLKVLRFSFPVRVVGPRAKDFLSPAVRQIYRRNFPPVGFIYWCAVNQTRSRHMKHYLNCFDPNSVELCIVCGLYFDFVLSRVFKYKALVGVLSSSIWVLYPGRIFLAA